MKSVQSIKKSALTKMLNNYLTQNMESKISTVGFKFLDGIYVSNTNPDDVCQVLLVVATAKTLDGCVKFRVKVVWNCNRKRFENISNFMVIKKRSKK